MAPSLSPDIIDHLLMSLPDTKTLLSTILVSKSFYNAFRVHPSSILTSVATNQIGPELLPCAIRLTQFNRDEYLASRASYVQNFPLEREFSRNEVSAVAPHLATLIRNDDVVTELELFFSITHKDRVSGTLSSLNPRESLRFRRALYRWWLLLYLFPACYLWPTRIAKGDGGDEGSDTGYDDSDADDDTGDDTDGDNDGVGSPDIDLPGIYHAKAQGLRKEFLSKFSDEEVAEMWQVDNFMRFVFSCAGNAAANYSMYESFLLCNGLDATTEVLRSLRSFNEPNLPWRNQGDKDYNHRDSNWPGLFNYLEEKNYDTSKVGTNTRDPVLDKNVILDSKVEDTEECDECRVLHLSPKLWSSSNWHLLPCAVSFIEVLRSLPSNLTWNSQKVMPLKASRWSFISFVNLHVSSETPDWSEGKLLCKQCVLELMGRRILNSLQENKAQQGPQLEDYWCGVQLQKAEEVRPCDQA